MPQQIVPEPFSLLKNKKSVNNGIGFLTDLKSTISIPSPTHLDVRDDALMEKNVDLDCDAMHFPEKV